jgi:hypothetical protein
MKTMDTIQARKLAAPGAGLPKIEQFFARRLIFWKARRTSREQAASLFGMECSQILTLVGGLGGDQLTRRVLIRRLPGLEDSSRYWSVLMTLDHLRIVNSQVGGVIVGLGSGERPEGSASIAAVKPAEDVDMSVMAAFEQGCRDFEKAVKAVPDLKTALRFEHPWFGPMDASQWHFMAGFHMTLHRRQIERIVAGL